MSNRWRCAALRLGVAAHPARLRLRLIGSCVCTCEASALVLMVCLGQRDWQGHAAERSTWTTTHTPSQAKPRRCAAHLAAIPTARSLEAFNRD